MGLVEDRLAESGFSLPQAPGAVGSYLPATHAGDLVFTAGQLPFVDGSLITSGTVPETVSVDTAARCASQCALNALAAAATVCDLSYVKRVVKVVGYVASAPGFAAQPKVVDGASKVMLAAFGDAGKHAREAVGVSALPMGAPVELSIVLELDAAGGKST